MLIEYNLKWYKLCKSRLCAMFMKQNAVGMQVLCATVGQLGPNWDQIGSHWVTTGSNAGHLGRLGQAKGSWVMWAIWVMRAIGQANMCKITNEASGFSHMGLIGY